jgi:hypothetical protein
MMPVWMVVPPAAASRQEGSNRNSLPGVTLGVDYLQIAVMWSRGNPGPQGAVSVTSVAPMSTTAVTVSLLGVKSAPLLIFTTHSLARNRGKEWSSISVASASRSAPSLTTKLVRSHASRVAAPTRVEEIARTDTTIEPSSFWIAPTLTLTPACAKPGSASPVKRAVSATASNPNFICLFIYSPFRGSMAALEH